MSDTNLSLMAKTKEIINRYDFAFKKNFGQNFLIDERVLNKIIAAADITEEDTVLEVGPGIGTLTQALAKSAKKVIAVEIDKTLVPILGEVLADYNNIEIINNDILKVDVAELVRQNGGKALKLVANLPYYITTPIIMGILEQKLPVESITVMIQKEVALRMQAAPSTKDYGALSLAVQYYCEPYLVANVPQNCFMPRPNVDSAVIRLTPHKNPPVVAKNEQLMFKLIKVAFSQRRKTLLNCIFNSNEWGLDKEQIAALLVQSGFDERVRGETLTLEDFARLSDTLNDMNN
jgi:16S rRNA (adenine1518-N6/adenine1519-N6)-dimethyltransferase